MEDNRGEINIDEPIIWADDLNGGYTADWCGLTLHAKDMDEYGWWWAVYDRRRNNAQINVSPNDEQPFTNGKVSKQAAENIAKQYMATISGRIVAKFFIAGTFKITGRGAVFGGVISDGWIISGNTAEFFIGNSIWHRKIAGVDAGIRSSSAEMKAGILLKCKNEAEVDELREINPAGQTAAIYE